jgi:uncharacterized Rmd1/YagE family protein
MSFSPLENRFFVRSIMCSNSSLKECVAHATAKSYNLEALNEHFKKNNIEFKYNEPAGNSLLNFLLINTNTCSIDVTWRRCGTGNVYYFRQVILFFSTCMITLCMLYCVAFDLQLKHFFELIDERISK